MNLKSTFDTGFSLLEILIVLIVLSVLSGSFIQSKSQQKRIVDFQLNQQYLNDIKTEIKGFYALHGRWPCPADESGVEGWKNNACDKASGVLAYKTLGLKRAQDIWGQNWFYSLAEDIQICEQMKATGSCQSTTYTWPIRIEFYLLSRGGDYETQSTESWIHYSEQSHQFDDQMVWMSENEAIQWRLQTGWVLPD